MILWRFSRQFLFCTDCACTSHGGNKRGIGVVGEHMKEDIQQVGDQAGLCKLWLGRV